MPWVYSNANWPVYRLLSVPEDSMNATPYLERGWCAFESGVSVIAANQLLTIQDGKKRFDAKSPVPSTAHSLRIDLVICPIID